MTSYFAEITAILAVFWMPYLFKLLAADIAIGLVILPTYLWLRKAERNMSRQHELKWGKKGHSV